MANIGGKLGMKVLTIAVGIPVGIFTRKLVERAWIASGADRPRTVSDERVQWADAIGWAVLTGVGMAVADLATRKGAEEVYRTLLGGEPPVVKTKASKKVAKAEPKFAESIAPPN